MRKSLIDLGRIVSQREQKKNIGSRAGDKIKDKLKLTDVGP